MSKVSVIIPVYNGKDYIKGTLECIANQSFQDMEVIVVDDGSTDNTADIVKDFQVNHQQIQYIYQKKKNAGVARNLGMEKASGEYLLFLDGDDLFEEDLVEELYHQMVKDDADVCICNADQYDTEQETFIVRPQYLRKKCLPETRPFSRKDIGNAILYFTTSVPWNKMVKKKFLEENNILFQDIERANDQYFSVMTLLLAKRITIVDKVLVHYRVKQKGNLTTEFSDTPLCAFESMQKIHQRLQECRLLEEEQVRQAFDNKVINLMIYSLNIQNTLEGYRRLYEVISIGGFQSLGVVLREEAYYFNKLEYENFQLMNKYSWDEYLFIKNRQYRDTIAYKNLQYKFLTKEKNDVQKELKNTQKELSGIKNRKWYKVVMKLLAIYEFIFRKNRVKK